MTTRKTAPTTPATDTDADPTPDPTPTSSTPDPTPTSSTPDTTPDADTPKPKPKGTTPRKTGRPSKADAAIEDRTRRVSAAYQKIGAMLLLAGLGMNNPRMMAAGGAMGANAEQLGESWAQWADTSPRVARIVDSLSSGGAAGAVLLAHVPIARALMSPDTADASGDLGALLGMFTATEPT